MFSPGKYRFAHLPNPLKNFDDVVGSLRESGGRIEEITLTYVVNPIFGTKRRLNCSNAYFIEKKPFSKLDPKHPQIILGTVFIHTDLPCSFDKTKLKNSPGYCPLLKLWDGKVNVLQVTDAKARVLEDTCLNEAVDSPTAWDLRVGPRKMIGFLLKKLS